MNSQYFFIYVNWRAVHALSRSTDGTKSRIVRVQMPRPLHRHRARHPHAHDALATKGVEVPRRRAVPVPRGDGGDVELALVADEQRVRVTRAMSVQRPVNFSSE